MRSGPPTWAGESIRASLDAQPRYLLLWTVILRGSSTRLDALGPRPREPEEARAPLAPGRTPTQRHDVCDSTCVQMHPAGGSCHQRAVRKPLCESDRDQGDRNRARHADERPIQRNSSKPFLSRTCQIVLVIHRSTPAAVRGATARKHSSVPRMAETRHKHRPGK